MADANSTRLPVLKTYKLYIAGALPRSESGRSDPILSPSGAVVGHSCKASRKDLRDAVGAARKALPGWSNATAYNRGQILYRLAEMLEGKRAEMAELLALNPARDAEPDREITAAIDRLVAFAGWTDKIAHILGSQNAVAGPYWNITVPEAVGVVGVVCGPRLPLLGLVSALAPVVACASTAVVISDAYAPVVSVFGEVCATSDVPAGVINLLTGSLDELVPVLAKHRDVDGAVALGAPAALVTALREGTADNLKRVIIRPEGVDLFDEEACASPAWLHDLVEYKTVWHPVGV
jgi:acyl-CoA reductase-like NAD-dependent aldehyde dehydrogenase